MKARQKATLRDFGHILNIDDEQGTCLIKFYDAVPKEYKLKKVMKEVKEENVAILNHELLKPWLKTKKLKKKGKKAKKLAEKQGK